MGGGLGAATVRTPKTLRTDEEAAAFNRALEAFIEAGPDRVR